MDKKALARLSENNLRAQEGFALLLGMDRPLYDAPQEVLSFARDCQIDAHDAFLLLIAAALRREEDRAFLRDYLAPAVSPLSAADYRSNPYLRQIRFPEASLGAWRFTHRRFAPYQLIPAGSMRLMPDGRELPRIGYFTDFYEYPAVLEDGREWMTVTPNEIETMQPDVDAAFGRTAVFGLGLGYFAFMASEKESVSGVTVIERDENVIRLFETHLLPQFPHREKVRILRADAFDYAERRLCGADYDFAFVDLWHDVGDGLERYLRFLRIAKRSPEVDCRFWIEDDLLIFLRSLMIEDRLHAPGHLDRHLPPGADLPALSRMRAVAAQIDPRETRPSD